MSFFHELKRRNVLKVAAAYAALSWLAIEVVVTLREVFPNVPIWLPQALIVLLVLGIVPVLVFSWVYELTPEGFKRDEDVRGDRSYSEAVGRRLIYATIAGVFVGLGLFAWTRVDVVTTPEGTVAIFPFTNLSTNNDNKHFSDGLPDVLRNALSEVENLTVAPRRTTIELAELRLEEIHSLGISHILDGSVQRSGSRIRIITQLVRTSDGAPLWSKEFDREIDDIFAVQDEIAFFVANALLTRIGIVASDLQLPPAVDTESFAAYDLYLRALARGKELSVEGTNAAISHLQEALRIDPDFVDAKIELGWMHIQMLSIDSRASWGNVFEQVELLARQVLDGDPDNVTARYFMLVVEHVQSRPLAAGEWPKYEQRYRALIAQAVDKTRMFAHFAIVLRIYEENEAASEILTSLLEADPLNPSLHTRLAELNLFTRNFEQAQASARRAEEIDGNSTRAIAVLGQAALFEGDIKTFLESWQRGWEIDASDQDFPAAIAKTLYGLGFIEEGDWYGDRARIIGTNSTSMKSLELQRAMARDDTDKVAQLSRQAIKDDRLRNPYSVRGARFILCNAANADEVAEVVQFIDTHVPGFAEPGSVRLQRGPAFVRIECLASLEQVYTPEQLSAAVDGAKQLMFEGVFATAPQIQIRLYVHGGDEALAVDEALNRLFSKHLAEALWFRIPWRELLADPALAEVAADSRIQRAMDRWQQQEKELREAVEAYFRQRPGLLSP